MNRLNRSGKRDAAAMLFIIICVPLFLNTDHFRKRLVIGHGYVMTIDSA